MEKRVFRRSGFGLRLLNGALLFFSAVLLLSGLLQGKPRSDVTVALKETATPIPLDETYDETPESREWTTPNQTWYALQLGTFDNAEGAEELAAQYKARGAAGYVWHDNRYRTLAALYETKDDAQGVRTKLWENHGIDAYPYEIELPELTLRMKGKKGQLDILQAAFVQAQGLVASLQNLSVRMDRQEETVPDALAEMQLLRSQAQTLSLRLNQRFEAPRNQTVQGLIDTFDDYAVFCDTLNQQASAVELATSIKYEALSALFELKTICDQMGES